MGERFRIGSGQPHSGGPFSAAINSPEEPFGTVIVQVSEFTFFESPIPPSHFLVTYQLDLKVLR